MTAPVVGGVGAAVREIAARMGLPDAPTYAGEAAAKGMHPSDHPVHRYVRAAGGGFTPAPGYTLRRTSLGWERAALPDLRRW